MMIYTPKGRAREYAALACNIYRGCDHQCVYCYAPGTKRMSREDFGKPAARRDDFVSQLMGDAGKRQPSDRVLLCFTCDPYQHLDIELGLTCQTIEVLHGAGHAVQVLTKGGSRALRDLDLFTDADAFATTLTLISPEHSLKWEPGAALPQDRIDTIRKFHAAGIPTWVSLEPVLNPDSALEIIRMTHEFVDLYKVGKLNYHKLAKQIDWAKFANDAVELLDSLGKAHYVKDDLAKHMQGGPR